LWDFYDFVSHRGGVEKREKSYFSPASTDFFKHCSPDNTSNTAYLYSDYLAGN
jgi:hypothetical protein